jgi:hypothetical protein
MTHATDDVPEAAPDAPEVIETPPAQRPRRARKFSLPDHHVEEGVGARIEAFLDGPPAPRRRGRAHRIARFRPLRLDTAHDWSMALQHEAARQTRYGRPTAILVLELRGLDSGSDVDVAADEVTDPTDPTGGAPHRPVPSEVRRLIDVIAQEARETDRAMRSATRILVMLPETTEEDAAHLAGRIERGYRTIAGDGVTQPEIRIEIAVPRRGADPQDAIDDAERRLDDALEAG